LWRRAALPPPPPRPARTVIQARLQTGAGRLDLPDGTLLTANSEQGPIDFSLVGGVTFLEARLRSVQVFDGKTFSDRTRPALGRVPFPPFGSDPSSSDGGENPVLYLGFDRALLPNAMLSLYFR